MCLFVASLHQKDGWRYINMEVLCHNMEDVIDAFNLQAPLVMSVDMCHAISDDGHIF